MTGRASPGAAGVRRVARAMPGVGTVASAVLLVLVYPPWEVTWLAWVALVPWLVSVAGRSSAAGAAVQGLWLSVLLGLGGAPWIADAAMEYLGLSRAAGLAALMLHVCTHQPQLLLFAPLFRACVGTAERRATGGGFAALILFGALAYTGLDWAVPKLLRDSIGLVLHDHPQLRQAAELGGIHLLTFVILMVNLVIFAAWSAARVLGLRSVALARALAPSAVIIAVLLAGLAVFGAERTARWRAAERASPSRVQVGIVQGGLDKHLKRDALSGVAKAAENVVARYVRATDGLFLPVHRVDFVLWPETAYPGIFRKPESDAQLELNVRLDRYIASRGVPFVFGAYDREEGSKERVLQNAVYFVEPAVGQDLRALSPMQVHHKSRLFPVGEFLPLLGSRFAREWLPGAASLAPGPAPVLRTIRVGPASEPLRLGAAICYEDLFPTHTLALAREGAELLVNVSNDAWFGDRGEPRFHLIMARLRSIETRLPQVRATGTGYSAMILPSGDLAWVSAYGGEQAEAVSVPIVPREPTLMMRWGDWFGASSLVFAALGVPFVFRGSPRDV